MTTQEKVEELRKLLGKFVRDEISEEDFYGQLKELSARDPDAIIKLRQWLEETYAESQNPL